MVGFWRHLFATGAPRIWGYWRRIVTVNLVAALVAFGLLGGFVSRAPRSVLAKSLAISLVYANSVGAVLAFVQPWLLGLAGQSRTKRWMVRLAAIPVLIVAGCLVAGLVLVLSSMIRPRDYLPYFYGSLWISFIVGTAASLAVTAYETLRTQLEATSLELKTQQLEQERARKIAIEAQLASLESRVHPHFLFNTLNSIAALVHDDPAAAERVVGQLASLMRSSLDSTSTPLVPLEQELRIVRDYLDIERIRFGERLRYRVEIDPHTASVLVPRLSLQTLVENSVKFAVSPRREGATIALWASASNGSIRLHVEDDGPGFDASQVPDGHGLALLRSRLAMIFGDRAALGIESRPGRTCLVIDLPLDAQEPGES